MNTILTEGYLLLLNAGMYCYIYKYLQLLYDDKSHECFIYLDILKRNLETNK
jgi:hypothetical protein